MPRKNDNPEQKPPRPVCPVCGGELVEVRAKLQCSRCHTIFETCCEGGRGQAKLTPLKKGAPS